ncbi:MAG: hypothetical protein ACI4WM_07305 [Erysipelotrichaceae bacterium]
MMIMIMVLAALCIHCKRNSYEQNVMFRSFIKKYAAATFVAPLFLMIALFLVWGF